MISCVRQDVHQKQQSDLEQELKSLLQKKERREFTRCDISRIMALNWQLYCELDEIENYLSFLKPEERFPEAKFLASDL